MNSNVRRSITALLVWVGLLALCRSVSPSAQRQSQTTPPVDDSFRVVIPHTTHPLALPELDQGPVDGGLAMEDTD